jgi:transcription antitermination factor NusG
LRWYALAVHTRSEASAAAGLRTLVDDLFLPVRVERRAWSDRVKRTEEPLFPGYLFVRASLSAAARVTLRRVRHVVDLVGRLPADERIARPVPDAEIEALRVVVNAECALDPIVRLVPGRRVLVASGPLRGARGIVEVCADGHRRLVVQISLLGRGVRAVLHADDVVLSQEMAA